MKDVRLYKGKRPIKVPIERLFEIVKSIAATGKEQDFLELCAKEGLSVVAEPKAVNTVKLHLAENEAHKTDVVAANVQRSSPPAGSPPSCWPLAFADKIGDA